MGKYRITQAINIDVGGKVVSGVGTEFETDKDMSRLIAEGYVEPAAPKAKISKELTTGTAPKARRGKRGD